MAFPNMRRGIVGVLSLLLTLSACRDSSTLPVTVIPVVEESELPAAWQAYTNTNYNFSIEYPPYWHFREFSALESSLRQDVVWFSAEDFPPSNTDARPDLTLVVNKENPLARWREEFFDEYRSEIAQLGNGTAIRITGVNKESLYRETVVIIKLSGVYLEIIPGQSAQSLEVFDRIIATFSSPELQPAELPSTDPPSETLPEEIPIAEKVACIAPYFDPVAFLPGNERLVLRSDSGIMVYNLNTLQADLAVEPELKIIKAALSQDGRMLAWALEDHSIELVELPSGKKLKTFTGHTAMIAAMKFSQAGDRLYTASHDTSVKIWDINGGLISELYPGGGEVFGIAVSPDDRKLVIVTFEGAQKLWDMETNELIGEIGISGAFDGSDAIFSSDGQVVGIGLGSGPVSLWDIEEGTKIWSGGNYSLALSQNKNLMAYSDMDESGYNWVFIRELDDWRLIHPLRGHNSLIWKLFFSPDSSMLVSADGTEILIWQTDDGKLLYNLVSSC